MTKQKPQSEIRRIYAGIDKGMTLINELGIRGAKAAMICKAGGLSQTERPYVQRHFNAREKELRGQLPTDPKAFNKFVIEKVFAVYDDKINMWIIPTMDELIKVDTQELNESIVTDAPKRDTLRKFEAYVPLPAASYAEYVALLPAGEDT
jgi:hypothetical protein